ncbi:sulfatase [Listeria costaricensis]|uniref:sulfatase family protein n=1 Tax=Listeria costaricensis TaxID=2026604 RepID=UPI000C08BCA4|nr:sulfatase [Listeria costaricensis]
MRQNVLWIVADQLRAQALSLNHDQNVVTPNIDRLARTGMSFSDAVSGYPVCCPFRGSMLTSIYPHKCVPAHEKQLDPRQPTIANVFNDNGYETFYLGKWHLDGYQERFGRAADHIIPPERRGGFQKWIAYENNNSQWDCYVHGEENGEPFHRRLDGYETDCLTDYMLDYLDEKQNDDTPFFAVLSVQPPHDPYLAPAEDMAHHHPCDVAFRPNVPPVERIQKQAADELAGYYAMIENLDRNIGRVLEKLMDTGLFYNTHVIFFSDHGDMHGSHGLFRKMVPYEESIRIPFVISGMSTMGYDGYFNGEQSGLLLNHVDIAPTTLGLCGIEKPDWMEGQDYSAYRYQKTENWPDMPESVFLQSITGHNDSVDLPWRGVLTRDGYKYVCFEKMPWLLFDLNDDPYEFVNLVHNDRFAKKRHELHQMLKEWLEKTGDPFALFEKE